MQAKALQQVTCTLYRTI